MDFEERERHRQKIADFRYSCRITLQSISDRR